MSCFLPGCSAHTNSMFFHTEIFDRPQHWLENVICSVRHVHSFLLMTPLCLLPVSQPLPSRDPSRLICWGQLVIRLVIIFIIKKIHGPNSHVDSIIEMISLPPDNSSLSNEIASDPLEEEMATYSSILAWEIPRTEEPEELQFMGSQRVGHTLATEQQQQGSPRLSWIPVIP